MVGISKALRVAALTLTVGLTASGRGVALAEESDPKAIIAKVIATYGAMKSYQSDGVVVTDTTSVGGARSTSRDFSIRLQKPHLFRISWGPGSGGPEGFRDDGTVWNAGGQPYLYLGMKNAYSKMKSNEMALASAAGLSGGAAVTIPSLFLSALKGIPPPLSRLIEPKLARMEKLEGEDCYVISGGSAASKEEEYWISAKRYLILKQRSSLESPKGGSEAPEMTDQQIVESLKAMGQEATKEAVERMRTLMKGAKESLGRANRRSTWTTTYQNIRSAELTAQDFEFKPPEGAVLKENLFDMKEAMATHAQTIALKCMISLGRIGTAMRQYAKDHDGRFPKSSKWCDELCGKYIGAWFVFLELPEFSAGDTDLKATDYGFNENLSGIKMTEVRDPARTVLAFEAERGQNVSGGSTRIISTPRHGEGFNIVFVDGHTETVPKGELGKLVWTVKER